MIPLAAYGLFYMGNLFINGVECNDWYGFAKAGPEFTIAGFAIILAANWIIALLLRLPRMKRGV